MKTNDIVIDDKHAKERENETTPKFNFPSPCFAFFPFTTFIRWQIEFKHTASAGRNCKTALIERRQREV